MRDFHSVRMNPVSLPLKGDYGKNSRDDGDTDSDDGSGDGNLPVTPNGFHVASCFLDSICPHSLLLLSAVLNMVCSKCWRSGFGSRKR